MEIKSTKNLDIILNSLSRVTSRNNELPDMFNTNVCFEPITFNNFKIILIGGIEMFSEPQVYYDKAANYYSLQVYILENVNSMCRIIKPSQDIRLQKYPWVKYFIFNEMNQNIALYHGKFIPIKDVYQLISDVYRISKLTLFF